MKKIVLASNNAGKLREFARLLEPLHCEIVAQGQLGVSSCEEPFHTFVENALTKARHASRETRLPAIADDSGICVDALGGAPGVFSARFAGEPSDDAKNNALLIEKLQGQSNRRAHYLCVLVAVRHADDPEPLIAVGRWFGEVINQPQGDGGFGYDPYFYLPNEGCTAAQLSSEAKNAVSHRGQAMAKLLEQIQLCW